VVETTPSEGFQGKVNGGRIKERRKGDEELRHDVRCSPLNLNSRLHFLVIINIHVVCLLVRRRDI
jgi:hypothetical protein